MNLSGPLADRFGARMPSVVGGVVMVGAGVVMGFAPSYPVLVARGCRLRSRQRGDGRGHERVRGQRRAGTPSPGDEPAARVLLDRQPRRRPGRRRARPAPRRRQAPQWSLWTAVRSPAVLLVAVFRAYAAVPEAPVRGRREREDPAGGLAARRDGRLLRPHRGHRRRLVLAARHRRGRGQPVGRRLGPGLRQRLHGGDPTGSATSSSSTWAARSWSCLGLRLRPGRLPAHRARQQTSRSSSSAGASSVSVSA